MTSTLFILGCGFVVGSAVYLIVFIVLARALRSLGRDNGPD